MIASGVVAAPWEPSVRHQTHRARGMGPTGVQLNSYHPPSTFEGYGVNGMDHSVPNGSGPDELGKSFLQDKLGVSSDGLTKHAGHSFDGTRYEYYAQTIGGIPIVNAVANVALKGDKVMSYGASFIKPKNIAGNKPKIDAPLAISKAESAVGGKYNGWPTSLKYFATPDDDLLLVYVMQIQNAQSGDWKEVHVDADTGSIVNHVDYVANHSYNVVPIQNQDPSTGFEVIHDPQDLKASPDGWHKLHGSETGATSGNNAISYFGLEMLSTKESSAEHNYNYTMDPSKPPSLNMDIARVNAFYVVNSIHDLTYNYGFDEGAYNFQEVNFSEEGKGGDRVLVSIQDPSGVNNANFATPPDGQHGQMRMFIWTITSPPRDGALENDIVTHEMTHGISNRMTGGGTGECLQSNEAGGMGEGWSDAMADILQAKSNPLEDFTMGSYVTNNPAGIRSHPYSVNKTTNPLTYGSLKKINEVHDIGEVWATMLHGCLFSLIEELGLCNQSQLKDPESTCGQAVMLHLVLDGFALQPCSPTFVSARDAIIQADANRYGGAHKCLLWHAFADRGLGNGAGGDYTDNTDVPEGC
ncbi:extracellular metalloproteinase MEP [Ceratobasidium sp. AG-Ba]|nr:extracellular metalloproteinase MEP [Ceratobasidium sp. AG-Ba]QRW08304.1 extracellular metalloproteinase MEP [Ceratobasidium sp. AG-Ba]